MIDFRSGVLSQHCKGSTVRGFLFHELLQVEEMDKWKATPRNNVFLEISGGAPNQDC